MPVIATNALYSASRRRLESFRRIVATVTLAATLTACTTGFVYNRLDWVVSWYVNGIVSLESEQERHLKDIVQRTLQWHRETQIPAYLTLLEQLERDTAGSVTAEQIEGYYQAMTVLLDEFLLKVVPDAAELLGTLTPGQLAELAANLEESNEELWEEYGGTTPELRAKRRVRNAIRVIQRFTGRLSSAQRQLVEGHLAQMRDVSERWLERRRHWQQRFVGLLRDPPPLPELQQALLDMALNPNQFDTAQYRAQVEANRAVIMAMLADLTNSLDTRQRARLQKKFRGYAEDLREIGEGG